MAGQGGIRGGQGEGLAQVVTMTAADAADGTGTMSIQIVGALGLALWRQHVVTWISTADYAAPVATTDFSVATGVEHAETTANAEYDVIPDATGLIVMDIADAGTFYVMAEIDGRIYSKAITITGP